MLSHQVRRFLRDERGSYTIWSLIWFMMYVAIGGLAVDITDAYQKEHLLQASADAAALAGVMSLATEDEDPKTAAVMYARGNMDRDIHGTVLTSDDVVLGTWDFDSEIFYKGTPDPNAVYVTTRRHEQNHNPVAMNFLRILSLVGIPPWFNINAEAIAVMYHPDCLFDGFIAYGEVYFRSKNNFGEDFCIHGHTVGVRGRMGNIYGDGVSLSYGPGGEYDFPPGAYDDLEGHLKYQQTELWPYESIEANVQETIAYLRQQDITGEDGMPLISALLDPDYASWDYLYSRTDDDGTIMYDQVLTYDGGSVPETWESNKVYVFTNCGQINLGSDVELDRVAIVADCRIHSAANTDAGNVIFASTYTGGGAAVHLAAGSGLGSDEFCETGYGGVEVHTLGDVMMAAGGEWNGLRVTAVGDIHVTSQNDGGNGIAFYAGGDIDVQTTSSYGLCPHGPKTTGPLEWRYRLVR